MQQATGQCVQRHRSYSVIILLLLWCPPLVTFWILWNTLKQAHLLLIIHTGSLYHCKYVTTIFCVKSVLPDKKKWCACIWDASADETPTELLKVGITLYFKGLGQNKKNSQGRGTLASHRNIFPSQKCVPSPQYYGGWESSTHCDRTTYANDQNTSQMSLPFWQRIHRKTKNKLFK